MQKVYKIEVDCANCANLMEDTARKTKGVKACTISFMTQKMTVDFEDGFEEKDVMKAVKKNCQKVDDDFELYL